MTAPPSQARVVIVGGGAVGTSALFHLARMGWTDAVLLERDELTSGSTWHAAGNCPNHAGSWSLIRLQSYSTALYRRLGGEVGYPIDYHVTGAVRLAHTRERMRELAHICSMARRQGLDFEMLSVGDLKDRHPFIETHDLAGASWDPLDGDIDPAQLTQALARGARELGARIVRFCLATGVRRDGGEWVVETAEGDIRCEKVVNAAGYRAPEVARWFQPFGGRALPQVVLSHQYLVTEPVPALRGRREKLPLLRDPDSSYYLRQEKDGFLLGPYERACRAHWAAPDDPMPDDFAFQLFPDALDRLEPYIADACARVPILGTAGVKRVVNGPIPYTPDGNPLIGPMPGVPDAYEACVFTFGIVQAGGAGRVLAEWVANGETEWDMWSCDPRRFTGFADQAYAVAKGVEVYGHEYAVQFPRYDWPAGRGRRLSPLHDRLAALGAQFTASAGWERAAWYARPGDDTALGARATFEREGPWFAAVGEECRALRDAVGIAELPGFARFAVSGEGSAAWIGSLVTGAVPRVGRIGLVYFADPRGRVVTEMALLRTGPDEFELLGGAGAEWHDRDWLRGRLPAGSAIRIAVESGDRDCLMVMGPRAAAVLSAVCDADLSNAGFPWLTHREATIAGRAVRLVRVSYVGEPGWEIHLDNADAPAVFEAVWAAGAAHGIRPFGTYAMNACRIEKGYRAWKAELSTDFSMLEAGLERFVRFDKPDFPGRDALLAERGAGPRNAFTTLTVDAGPCDAPPLATIWHRDEAVGLVTSCDYGHRVGRTIALAMVRADLAVAGRLLEVEIFGERVAATVMPDGPLYDPGNDRLKG